MKSRIIWLDWIRSFAILFVVLIHVLDHFFLFNLNLWYSISALPHALVLSLYTFGRLGVPLFLFLSGYLLLNKTYSSPEIFSFWKNNFLRLLVTTEFWILFCSFFLSWYNRTTWDPLLTLRQLLFVARGEMAHMWYMPMILGFYVFIPFIANAVNSVRLKVFSIPLLLVFLYCSCVPSANYLVSALQSEESLLTELNLSFSGDYYGLLLLLGYASYKGIFKRLRSFVLLTIGIISFFLTVGFQLFTIHVTYRYVLWYNFAPLIVLAVCFFELFSRMNLKATRFSIFFSANAFAIYLIHNPIMLIWIRYLKITNTGLKATIVYALTLITSMAIVRVLCYIRPLRRILFAMK